MNPQSTNSSSKIVIFLLIIIIAGGSYYLWQDKKEQESLKETIFKLEEQTKIAEEEKIKLEAIKKKLEVDSQNLANPENPENQNPTSSFEIKESQSKKPTLIEETEKNSNITNQELIKSPPKGFAIMKSKQWNIQMIYPKNLYYQEQKNEEKTSFIFSKTPLEEKTVDEVILSLEKHSEIQETSMSCKELKEQEVYCIGHSRLDKQLVSNEDIQLMLKSISKIR